MPLCSRISPRASSLVGPGRGPREIGCPPGTCGRQVGDRDPSGAEVVREAGLVGAVHEHRVDPREEQSHEAGVAGVRLEREDVVADDDRLRARDRVARTPPPAGRPGPAASRGAQQREVGRHGRRDGVHDDDGVEPAQAAPDPHPAVGAGPAERPDRAREGRHLGHVDSPARHRDVVTVQPRGVEVGPRDEDDVVPGVLQVVGEHRRVGGDRRRCAGGWGRRRRCAAPLLLRPPGAGWPVCSILASVMVLRL